MLDVDQQACVDVNDAHMLIVAGPGSGKTTTIVGKCAQLIATGTPPDALVVTTFTNKAAQHLRKRMGDEVGLEAAANIHCGTYHALAVVFLRQRAYGVMGGDFQLLTTSTEALRVVRQYLTGIDASWGQHATAVMDLHRARAMRVAPPPPEAVTKNGVVALPPSVVQGALEAYRQYKVENRCADFDDLMHWWLAMLKEGGLDERIQYLVCDEVQDTNEVQNEIAKTMAREGVRVIAVGDDCQSIYGFRGSNMRHIHEFMSTFPGAVQRTLERNYRSTPEIADLCEALIQYNTERIDKRIRSTRENGSQPALYPFETATDELHYLAELCQVAVSAGTECAILFRTNREVDALEKEMRRRRIPFSVLKGKALLDRPHVRALIHALRFFLVPHPPLHVVENLLTVHKGVGAQTAKRIMEAMESSESNASAVDALRDVSPEMLPQSLEQLRRTATSMTRALHLIHARDEGAYSAYGQQVTSACTQHMQEVVRHAFGKHAGADEHAEDLTMVSRMVTEFDTFEEFMDAAGLGTRTLERYKEGDDNLIKLGTIHQAKGMEFDTCVISGCVDGGIPSFQSQELAEIEEERRVLYVGASRAKNQLCFTFARFATWDSRGERPRRLSVFLRPLLRHLQVRRNTALLPASSTLNPAACHDLSTLVSDFYRSFGRQNALLGHLRAVVKYTRLEGVALRPCPLDGSTHAVHSAMKPGAESVVLLSTIMSSMVAHPTAEWGDLVETAARQVFDDHTSAQRATDVLTGKRIDGILPRRAWPDFMDAAQALVDQLLAGHDNSVAKTAMQCELGSCVPHAVLGGTAVAFKYTPHHGCKPDWTLQLAAEAAVARNTRGDVRTVAVINMFTGHVWRASLKGDEMRLRLPAQMMEHPLARLLATVLG